MFRLNMCYKNVMKIYADKVTVTCCVCIFQHLFLLQLAGKPHDQPTTYTVGQKLGRVSHKTGIRPDDAGIYWVSSDVG